jgi:hypothetical protein
MKKLLLSILVLLAPLSYASSITWTIIPPLPVTGLTVISYNIYVTYGTCPSSASSLVLSTNKIANAAGIIYTQTTIPTGVTLVCAVATANWSNGVESSPTAIFQLPITQTSQGGAPLGIGGKYNP